MKPLLVSETLRDYLDSLVPPRTGELQRMEQVAQEQHFPIIGPVCGYFCYQIARMISARSVFEMGSGFGYSTAWFARAVQENGGHEVHHTVFDQSLSDLARNHLEKLGYRDLMRFHVGEAVQLLRETTGLFDLIFNDIDKEGYPESLTVIAEKLRPGGVLIVDNALWGGRIFNDEDQEITTRGVREITSRVVSDPAWISTLIPIRDGMLVAFKRN